MALNLSIALMLDTRSGPNLSQVNNVSQFLHIN